MRTPTLAGFTDPATPPVLNACNLATALMAGDPETLRQGYTPANAATAAVAYLLSQGLTLTDDDADTVRRVMEMRAA